MQTYYLNGPQMRALLIDAPLTVLIYGRRLGKSTEIIAHQSLNRIFDMQRGVFLLIGRTYKQVLELTLPATKTGWAKRGYLEDVHYVVGKKPPPSWPKPFYLPSSYEHTISWFNGSCFCLGSQDRPGLVNSLTVCGLFADEAKFLIEERFKEDALPTVSAPSYLFPDNPHNRFITLCSSMPSSWEEGEWLFNYQKLMKPDLCKAVLQAALKLEELKKLRFEASTDGMRWYYQNQILDFEAELAKARKGLVFYDEASTLANLEVLGMDYLYQQMDVLKDKFPQEILNLRPSPGAKSFYANLARRHFYTAYDYSYIDGLRGKADAVAADCRQDSDLVPGQPLIIGMDFGANINCIVTGQMDPEVFGFRTIKNHYVLRPKILDDVCEDWCRYYRFHNCKRVRFWYDKTGNNANSNSKLTYAQQAQRVFSRNGWEVEMCPVGGANTRHHEKYLLINSALAGKDRRFPRLLFNEGNCDELKESMQRAPAKTDSGGFIHKDKSSERRPSVQPQYATHLSDAWDTMIFGEFSSCLNGVDMGGYDVFTR